MGKEDGGKASVAPSGAGDGSGGDCPRTAVAIRGTKGTGGEKDDLKIGTCSSAKKCQEVACLVLSNHRAHGTQKHIISDGPRGRADFPRLKRVPHGVCQATSARV